MILSSPIFHARARVQDGRMVRPAGTARCADRTTFSMGAAPTEDDVDQSGGPLPDCREVPLPLPGSVAVNSQLGLRDGAD